MNFKYFLMAARLPTLTAIIGPVLVGIFLSLKLRPNEFDWIYILPIMISGLAIQIAANLFNDYLDHSKGGDKDDRLGPERITAKGYVALAQIKKWAIYSCCVAILFGIPIVIKVGWPFIVLGLFCVLLSYIYTGTKFSLAYTGTADLFVIVFFGGFAVWGTYYTLTLNYDGFPFLLGLQLGCLCNILLVVNNLRDEYQDKQNNKKTLVVRFGRNLGLVFYFLLIIIGFGGCWLWPEFIFNKWYLVLSLPWLFFSLYFWNWVSRHKPSMHYNKILKLSSLTYFGFCLSLCIGFKLL